MSETQKDKDSKIQDLPAKPVTREQGEAVKGGFDPVNSGKGKQAPQPFDPVNG